MSDSMHLTTEINWFIETSVLLKLENNIVAQVMNREELRSLIHNELVIRRNLL